MKVGHASRQSIASTVWLQVHGVVASAQGHANSVIAKRAATDYNRPAAQGSPGKENGGRRPFQINRRNQWRYRSHSRSASAASLAEFRGGDASGVEQGGCSHPRSLD